MANEEKMNIFTFFKSTKFFLSNYIKHNHSIREANICDVADVFDLSNEDIVRHISFNPEKIRWSAHQKWFAQMLDSEDCVFLVFIANGTFAGQVRFDIYSQKAVINISLVKDMRGLGLSSFVLDEAIQKTLKLRPDIKQFAAYIQRYNLISIKAFQNAQFKFSKDTVVKENNVKLYIRNVS